MGELYLVHYGIDGQKWGVKNGPPYPIGAGKHSAAEKRAMRKANKAEIKRRKEVRKYRRLLSDEDIRKENDRLEAEKKLSRNIVVDNYVLNGRKETSDILKSIGSKTLATVGTTAAIYAGSKLVGKYGDKVIPGFSDAMDKGFKKYTSPKK